MLELLAKIFAIMLTLLCPKVHEFILNDLFKILFPGCYLRHRVLLVAVVILVTQALPASRETLVTKETRVPWVLLVLRV